jgi:hypothetical protein
MGEPLEVRLRIDVPQPRAESLQPVTCGVPWPSGAVRAGAAMAMRDDRGRAVRLQQRELNRWLEGWVRWALLDWQKKSERSRKRALSVPVACFAAYLKISLLRMSCAAQVYVGYSRMSGFSR